MKLPTLGWHCALPLALLLGGCVKDVPVIAPQTTVTPLATDDAQAALRIFATGLNNPRGLKFGPDGDLYVAEGGLGGTHSSAGVCTQVTAPVGPVTGSPTSGRISRINSAGQRTTVFDGFPSSTTNPLSGGDVSGVSDVAFIGSTLYGLLAGAGCSHGVPGTANGVVKMNERGKWKLLANLSLWQQGHPVQHPEPGDFEPDGTPYSMITVGGNLYVVEPNHGELLQVKPNGAIKRIADISASQGHVVPTSVVYSLGTFLVGNLNVFPIVQGSSKVYAVTPGGHVQPLISGLTTVVGLALDRLDRLYVLENTTGAPFPTPGTGKVVRLDLLGGQKTIASGLTLPTAMTFGPDGKLYISNVGFGPAAIGGGEIVQIDINYPRLSLPKLSEVHPGAVAAAQ